LSPAYGCADVILRSYQFAVAGMLDGLLEQVFQGFETLGRLFTHGLDLITLANPRQHALRAKDSMRIS